MTAASGTAGRGRSSLDRHPLSIDIFGGQIPPLPLLLEPVLALLGDRPAVPLVALDAVAADAGRVLAELRGAVGDGDQLVVAAERARRVPQGRHLGNGEEGPMSRRSMASD